MGIAEQTGAATGVSIISIHGQDAVDRLFDCGESSDDGIGGAHGYGGGIVDIN